MCILLRFLCSLRKCESQNVRFDRTWCRNCQGVGFQPGVTSCSVELSHTNPCWVEPLARAMGAHSTPHAHTIPSSAASVPPLLSIPAFLELSRESVYPQSVGIVQLLRKCTKCSLLSFVELFHLVRNQPVALKAPFALHSRCQRGFGPHA